MRAERLRELVDALIPGGELPNGVTAQRGSETPALAMAESVLAEATDLDREIEALPHVDEHLLAGVEARRRTAFARLVAQVLAAYYETPAVLAAFGWRAMPPHPDGYALEPFDPALLDRVRRREPFWRR